ncbi:MAG TPA: DNA polymerase III subunit delta [Deltaproteobacteria bacterium]|nr:DNA polymerase III subunit delta [Deltaproteobacteria bacterium]
MAAMRTARAQRPLANAVFLGMESFFVEERLGRIKDLFEGDTALNWSVFNGDQDPDMDEIISLCNTLPFLSQRRVIVIRNAHKLPPRYLDRVLLYLDNPCETTSLILVLEDEKADRETSRLLKRFEGKADIERFEPIRNRNERIQWIMNRAVLMGKQMDKDAAVMLSDMTGSSVWYLASEIDKLCLYVGRNPTITGNDVAAAVMRTYEPAIFTFLDSLFERKKDALSRLYEIERSGVGELEIVSRIENQIIAHYAVLTGGQWKKMKIHEYTAEKAGKRKSLWSASQLCAFLGEVRRIEQRLKSSSLAHGYASLAEVIGRLVLPARADRLSGGTLPA